MHHGRVKLWTVRRHWAVRGDSIDFATSHVLDRDTKSTLSLRRTLQLLSKHEEAEIGSR
jgi:hypothetical protein